MFFRRRAQPCFRLQSFALNLRHSQAVELDEAGRKPRLSFRLKCRPTGTLYFAFTLRRRRMYAYRAVTFRATIPAPL